MDFASPHAAREMYSRAAWTIGFALVLYFINRAEYPGPAATLAAVIALIGVAMAGIGYALNWLSTDGQNAIQAQILDGLALQGSERVLSLSHELGIEAAKRLKSGKVISLGETDENEAARESAKNQGLIDRIRFESADLAKLSYPDANFDTVLSSRALGDLDREKAIRELVRVLKPGGRLTIHETSDIAAFQRLLAEAKLSEVTVTPASLPLGLGGSVLTARK
jgi:SAM-dependent methyltransferase